MTFTTVDVQTDEGNKKAVICERSLVTTISGAIEAVTKGIEDCLTTNCGWKLIVPVQTTLIQGSPSRLIATATLVFEPKSGV